MSKNQQRKFIRRISFFVENRNYQDDQDDEDDDELVYQQVILNKAHVANIKQDPERWPRARPAIPNNNNNNNKNSWLSTMSWFVKSSFRFLTINAHEFVSSFLYQICWFLLGFGIRFCIYRRFDFSRSDGDGFSLLSTSSSTILTATLATIGVRVFGGVVSALWDLYDVGYFSS